MLWRKLFKKTPTTLAVFPGQGSQRLKMGQDIVLNYKSARDAVAEVDEALGEKLSAVMWGDDHEKLTLTRNCQPALLATSVAVWRALEERSFGWNRMVGAVMGHSLGEFSALVCARSIKLADAARVLVTSQAVNLLKKMRALQRARGDAMQNAVAAYKIPTKMAATLVRPGKMAEFLDFVNKYKTRNPEELLAIANVNSPTQATLSGAQAAVDAVIHEAKQAKLIGGAKALDVSAPFHSPLMQPAADAVRDLLMSIDVAVPNYPVYANATGERMPSDPDQIRSLLVKQTTSPVLWHLAMENCFKENPHLVQVNEIGSGNVLSTLASRTWPNAKSSSIEDIGYVYFHDSGSSDGADADCGDGD